jgi:undecaprenyl-diphosphatase
MAKEMWQGDFKGPHASLAWWVAVGTIPTTFVGLFFKDRLEELYGSISAVGLLLVVTGAILIGTGILLAATNLISKEYGGRTRVGLLAALVVGTAQGLAIMPGISRSGTTIVAGLLCGLNRDLSGRFSFLLSIPAIIGAVVLQFDVRTLTRVGLAPLLLGFAASALVGFFALKTLMNMVRKGQLHYFAPYCCMMGLILVIFF